MLKKGIMDLTLCENAQACKLCGSEQSQVVYLAEPRPAPVDMQSKYAITNLDQKPFFSIVKCRRCQFVFASGHHDVETIQSFYKDASDDLYLSEEKGRRLSARNLLKRIKKLKPRGELLDIGCATGFLLDEARQMNYSVVGVELSTWAVKFARERFQLDVRQGSVLELDFPFNYFDVIVMTDVIEHLEDPLQALTKLSRHLKPNGLLCLTTPDIESVLSRLLGAKWWGVKHAHLIYFSRETMKKMLDRAGFNLVRVGYHSRTFSLGYLVDRLSFYDSAWAKIAAFFLKLFGKNAMLSVNFYDQLEFLIQKKRTLESLDQDKQITESFPAKAEVQQFK